MVADTDNERLAPLQEGGSAINEEDADPSAEALPQTLQHASPDNSLEAEVTAIQNQAISPIHFRHNNQGGGDVSVDMDFDVDDNYEMVMSFKCRHCSFLAADKSTLATHIRHRHVSGAGSSGRRHRHKSSHNHNTNTTNTTTNSFAIQDEMEHVGFDMSKIKMNKREIGKEEMPPIPSIPPTPEAFFIMSGDEEDEDSCQLLPLPACQNPNETNTVSDLHRINQEQASVLLDRDNDPLEMDDVFLCAECDIVFGSKELCCRHMHEIHGLEQFSAEFIQEVIISRKPGEDGENATEDNNGESLNEKTDSRILRKRVNPPKHLTVEEGTLVPKKFRVSKTQLFFCSKCLIKYESEQTMKLHETCHIELNEKCSKISNTKDDSANKKGDWNEKSRSNDEDDSMDADELDPNIEDSSSISKAKRNKSSSPTRPKFKCPICLSKDPQLDEKTTGERAANDNNRQDTRNESILKFFTKWSTCATHLWRVHQVDCELYSCTVCKKFKNYYITKVKDHERLHKPESNFVCNMCNKKFKQRHQLTTHQKYHKDNDTRLTPPSESRWYTPKECPICKRVLSDAKCLKKHISAVHKKLKPYCCNICNHMAARKAELKLHIRQHTNEKPFKCPHCPYRTGDNSSLRKHKLRHGDDRPYSCPYCEYRCIQSFAFKTHMISIHPDQEVVFRCHLCPHVTVKDSVASAHLKDHEEGRLASISSPSSQNDEDSSSRSSDRNGGPNHEDGNNSSSSNEYPEIGIRSFGRRRAARKTKSPQKHRWLEQDDSVDVIDTGGVTIPAPSVAPVPLDAERNSPLSSTNNTKGSTEKYSTENVNSSPSPSSSTTSRSEELSTVNLKDIA